MRYIVKWQSSYELLTCSFKCKLFFLPWRQTVRRRQSTLEMQTYNIDEMPSQQSAEHIYAGVRDSVATFQSGAYATLDSSYARVDCLDTSVISRDTSVISRDNCSRSKNKMKTLTTLFTLNSQDVKNILSKLDPDYK